MMSPRVTCAVIAGALLAPIVAYTYRLDFAYTDNFNTLAFVNATTWSDTLALLFDGRAGYRPLFYPLVKVVWSIAGPSVFVFRSVHLLSLAALVTLTLWVAFRGSEGHLHPLAVVTMTTAMLGLHTFRFMLFGIPFNMYLLVSLVLVIVLLLSIHGPSRARDVTAVALSLLALWLLETGIVACAVVALGYVTRPRRFGPTAFWGIVGGVGAYVAIRLLLGATPSETFNAETGFGFRELSVEEQRQLFSDFPIRLYLYNVATSVMTLLFSEPRDGIFDFIRLFSAGGWHGPMPWQWVNVLVSVGSTALISVWIIRGSHSDWQRFALQAFVLVVALNAVLSFPYTRDRIMSAAGVIYALVLAFAVAEVWRRASTTRPLQRRFVLAILILLACGWGVRYVGAVFAVKDAAWDIQRQWSARFEDLGGFRPERYQRTRDLKAMLRERVLSRRIENPEEDPEFTHRWFERQY